MFSPRARNSRRRHFARRFVCHVTGLFVLLAVLPVAGSLSARAASPPQVTGQNALSSSSSGGIVRGRWQPLLVTLANPNDGQAITGGEVQVTIEDVNRGGQRIATVARGVSLPAGPGVAQTVVYVRVPQYVVPNVYVQVTNGRGEIVTRRRLDKLALLPEQLTVVAHSDLPDALAYLRGARLGVIAHNGALRPFDDPLEATSRTEAVLPFGPVFSSPTRRRPFSPFCCPTGPPATMASRWFFWATSPRTR
jgi:hypothetical protein